MSAELSQVAAPGAPALRWKPYPAYKDSGVEWMGKVPEYWRIQNDDPIKRSLWLLNLSAQERW